jgi:hypothetical protein
MLVLMTIALRCKQNQGAISPAGGIRQRDVSASKRRFFVKKRAKNFIRLAASGGWRGRGLQPPKTLRAVTKSLARSAVMKFFCFFLFTKRRPSLPPSAGHHHAAR